VIPIINRIIATIQLNILAVNIAVTGGIAKTPRSVTSHAVVFAIITSFYFFINARRFLYVAIGQII